MSWVLIVVFAVLVAAYLARRNARFAVPAIVIAAILIALLNWMRIYQWFP